MSANTLYLRLEGALQAWGSHESKFVIRRVMDAPTKSGVIGLLLSALGISRQVARGEWLTKLSALRMGVRVDRSGMRWWDYQTVGAGMKMRIAGGGTKDGPILTRREYMCDASYLVALHGQPDLIATLAQALCKPAWTLYLGRKCCPPSLPVFSDRRLPPATHDSPLVALQAVPVDYRMASERPASVTCFLDWAPEHEGEIAPADAQIWYDVPVSLDPPAHLPRFVTQHEFVVGQDGGLRLADKPLQERGAASPLRPSARYENPEYRRRRAERIDHDQHLCVFCKSLGTTVQHITYRHAGGDERIDELATLCRLCHDAVTMVEYGENMGLDRIDPTDPKRRQQIVETRAQIIKHRSLETRRRRLQPDEVE